MTTTAAPTLARYLSSPLRAGEPDVAGALAVFPLFGPPPVLEYLAFAQGIARGVAVRELAGGASVNDLTVANPTATPVLLYDGEEVLGAQQNRTFDTSVLVPPGAKLDVPVSCVEHGRWDASRHAEHLAPAPQAAYPELRRAKSRHVRMAVAMGLQPRALQDEVWADVERKSARLGVTSRTGAMHDIFEQRRDRLAELRGAVRLRDGQLGALVAVGGRFTVLDHVSRPDVFAALHDPLLQGYALDALEGREAAPPTAEAATAFIATVCEQRLSERDGIGLGREARFAAAGVAGTALVAGDELIQVTAFTEDDDDDRRPPHVRTRIRRPSRRA